MLKKINWKSLLDVLYKYHIANELNKYITCE